MKVFSIGLFGLLLFISSAHAGILINSTRVIYPAASSEVTLGMTNNATTPRLIQSWIDDGDADASPGKISVPFVVTPPYFSHQSWSRAVAANFFHRRECSKRSRISILA